MESFETNEKAQFYIKDAERKLRLAAGLYDFYYQVKLHQIRARHPACSARTQHELTLAAIDRACGKGLDCGD